MTQTMGNQLLFVSLLIVTTLVVVRATFAQQPKFSIENCLENFKIKRDSYPHPELRDPARFCLPDSRPIIEFDEMRRNTDENRQVFESILDEMQQDCKWAIEFIMRSLQTKRYKPKKAEEKQKTIDFPYCRWMSFEEPGKFITEIKFLFADRYWLRELVDRSNLEPALREYLDDFRRVEDSPISKRVLFELLDFPCNIYRAIYGEKDCYRQFSSDNKELIETIQRRALSAQTSDELRQTIFASHFEDVRNVARAAVVTLLRIEQPRSNEAIERLVASNLVEGCKTYLAAYKHVFEDNEHLRNLNSDNIIEERWEHNKGEVWNDIYDLTRGARTYLNCFLLTNYLPAGKLVREVHDHLNKH